MNKRELLKKIATGACITQSQAEKALDIYHPTLRKHLEQGGSVSTIGLGTFSVVKTEPKKGRAERTGDAIKRGIKNIVKFTPGKALGASIAKRPVELKEGKAKRQLRAKTIARPAKKRADGKTPKINATATILGIIERSKKGIDTATLKDKTGFTEKKIWDIVSRAKREGKIKGLRKGIYSKAEPEKGDA